MVLSFCITGHRKCFAHPKREVPLCLGTSSSGKSVVWLQGMHQHGIPQSPFIVCSTHVQGALLEEGSACCLCWKDVAHVLAKLNEVLSNLSPSRSTSLRINLMNTSPCLPWAVFYESPFLKVKDTGHLSPSSVEDKVPTECCVA